MAAQSQGFLRQAPGASPTSTSGQPLMNLPTEQQQQMNTMMPSPAIGGPPPIFPHPPQLGMPLLPSAPRPGSDPGQPLAGGPRPPLMERPGLAPPMRYPPPARPPLGDMPPGGGPRPLMGLLPPHTQQRGPPLQETPPPGAQTEVWFEYKTPEGKVYYSHPQTQKTTWEKPKDVQIIPQPSSVPSALGLASPSTFPSQSPRLLGAPSGVPPQLVPTRVWSEHKTQEGKVYFYNKVTKQSVWEKPNDFELVMPLPANFGGPGSTDVGPLQGVPNPTSQPQQVGSPSLVPQSGPVDSGPPNQAPPIHQPSPSGLNEPPEQMDVDGGIGQRSTDSEVHVQNSFQENYDIGGDSPSDADTSIPPSLIPSSSLSSTQAPSNQMHPSTQMTSAHQMPPRMPPSFNRPPPPFMMHPPMGHPMMGGPPPPGMMVPLHPPLGNLPPPRVPMQPPPMMATYQRMDAPPSQSLPPTNPPTETTRKEEPKGPRPSANVPVPGSPWSVVWTNDERSFFFNVTTRMSVWTMPQDLLGNPHVAKILDEPPWSRKRVGEVKSPPLSKRLRLDPNTEDSDDEDEDSVRSDDAQLPPTIISQGGAPVISKDTSSTKDEEQKVAQTKSMKSLEERQKDFKEMLLERGVSAFSTWDKELPKFVFDPRYLLLSTKERKSCFESFIRSRAEEERKEKRMKLKQKRDQFKALLEEAKLHSKSSFSEFASKYSKDERFKSIDKMKEREQLFSEYLTEIKKLSKQKEGTQKQTAKSKAEKTKSDFMEMLGESEALTERSQWKKMKSFFDRDTRYKAVESSTQREEWFKEFVNELSNQTDLEQERQERIQASLKEREREVKMSRSAQEKEWGRERDYLRKAEAIEDYKALLADMVRSSDATWYDTKRNLRSDRRWRMVEILDIDEKESLFREHLSSLGEKKRLRFRKLLEETPQISLTMPWKKARKLIKEDPRYKSFGDSDHRREHEYDKFLRDTMVTAKNDFKSLLKETKIISYKSHDMINESDKHYRDIVDVLKKDKRYLVLDCVLEDRDKMLEDYISDLHRKGPPPPPTATHPSERLRKSALGPLVT